MVGEELLKLFEHNWSERPIFKKDKEPLNLNEEEVGEKVENKEDEAVKNFLVKRAMSDETMMMTSSVSSSDDLFLSPRSVLTVKASPTKLQTILSGKEVNEFSTAERDRVLSELSEKEEQRRKKKQSDVRKRRRRGKSMSDLEYEELKGFIDLGFVFSEEDQRDSELVSIIPGLQRLVKKDVEVTEEEEEISNVNRPYLSEAWDHRGERKGKIHLMPAIKLKVPAPEVKEVVLKDHLKQWAHAVASTIR